LASTIHGWKSVTVHAFTAMPASRARFTTCGHAAPTSGAGVEGLIRP
jgi:hypothetical protein